MAWIKGYESSTPESATAPNNKTDDAYLPTGSHAIALKARFKGNPEMFPYGKNEDGGGSGGDG